MAPDHHAGADPNLAAVPFFLCWPGLRHRGQGLDHERHRHVFQGVVHKVDPDRQRHPAPRSACAQAADAYEGIDCEPGHICTGCIGDGPCEAEPEDPSVSADDVDAADAYDEERDT